MQHPTAVGSTRRPAAEAETRLAEYFAGYAASHESPVRHLLRNPLAAAHALQDLGRLAVLEVELGDSLESRLLGAALPRSARGPRSVTAVLALPPTAQAYSEGSSKQTLRRKVRMAERAGVTWSTVSDPDEKRLLLDLAIEHERSHPLEQYRKAPPQDRSLLEVGLWLLARAADGRPLLLSITPIDGCSALLGMFRTLEVSDEASTARYLMTKVLAEHLIRAGVTHLYDGVHPANLTNGLRHFQRMVGFRLVRIAQRPLNSTPPLLTARTQQQP